MLALKRLDYSLVTCGLTSILKPLKCNDGARLFRRKLHQKYQIYSNVIQRNPRRIICRRSTSWQSGLQDGPTKSPSQLLKPLVFTMAFSTGSFLAVSIWEYEVTRKRLKSALKNFPDIPWFRAKTHDKGQKTVQKEIEQWWSQLAPSERVFAVLCAINVAVFGLWKIPQMRNFMMNNFCSNPAARAVCWPMVSSTFSHYSFLHLLANMYVLHSFSGAAVNTLGKEQFVGLYLSAGVISSWSSYVYKIGTRQMGPSLGASGAIMAILSYVCVQYPHTQLSILFLPQFTFDAGSAIKVIMAVDFAGCLLRWKFFDHAAHLGGALFGAFWCLYGKENLWPQREHFLKYWHQWRSP